MSNLVTLVLALVLPLQTRTLQPRQPSSGPDVTVLLHTAEEALGRKDFADAVKALQSVVQSQPDFVPAWFNLGYAYSGLHQDADAAKAYQKAIELEPDLFEARLNLGILLLEAKRPQAALEQLDKAVALKPQHARAHLYHGRALNLSSQADAAEKQFQEALRLDPSLAIAAYDLGQLYLSRKQYAEARAAFQEASELDPKLPQTQLGLALAEEGLHDGAKAMAHFEQYLGARPDDLETRFHLARIYLDAQKNEEALRNLLIVERANPNLPGLAAALGDVNALLRRFPDSEKFYRQALITSPSEPDLHRALGQTLLDEEKLPESEAEFRAALKLDSHNREAAKGLASSLYLQKRYGEAVPFLEALVRSPEPPVGLFFVLATCYDHLQARPQALEAYEKFLSLSHGQSPDQEWQAQQRAKLLRRMLRK